MPSALVAGLDTFNGDTFGGLTPPLTYANGGNLQIPVCPYIVKVANGAFQLLNGGQRLCVPSAEVAKAFQIAAAGAS